MNGIHDIGERLNQMEGQVGEFSVNLTLADLRDLVRDKQGWFFPESRTNCLACQAIKAALPPLTAVAYIDATWEKAELRVYPHPQRGYRAFIRVHFYFERMRKDSKLRVAYPTKEGIYLVARWTHDMRIRWDLARVYVDDTDDGYWWVQYKGEAGEADMSDWIFCLELPE